RGGLRPAVRGRSLERLRHPHPAARQPRPLRPALRLRIVAPATHEELRRLYSQAWVGTYLPEPVLVETLDGKLGAAFCYLAPSPEPGPASDDNIDRIVTPARQHGFPEWYIARLESFRPR